MVTIKIKYVAVYSVLIAIIIFISIDLFRKLNIDKKKWIHFEVNGRDIQKNYWINSQT